MTKSDYIYSEQDMEDAIENYKQKVRDVINEIEDGAVTNGYNFKLWLKKELGL